jgi:predicted nuclease of restriction endonuclease-like (RecB) superfamily
MKFDLLVNSVKETHVGFQQYAVKSVNLSLTLRNWLIGFYIVEFEQKGEDRAKYGEKLLENLAERVNIEGLSHRNLKNFRLFFLLYPQIGHAVPDQLKKLGIQNLIPIGQTLSAQLQTSDNQSNTIPPTVSAELQISPTLSDRSLLMPPNVLIHKLSFSHFVELFVIKEPLKRTFYEIECIKGSWSVRELRRQINTLYFERSGMSLNKEKLSEITHETAETFDPKEIIKSIYSFEFLGLKAQEVVEEKDLEVALLNHIQSFLLELGHGFCFEARQKRILIDENYYFVDLVFYHRVLKCHILIELKVDEFKHEHLSQLNTYVSYFREEIKHESDNPPIGILLCTNKGKKLVEYALSGMDEKLFVSKYLVELPSKEILAAFIENEIIKHNREN